MKARKELRLAAALLLAGQLLYIVITAFHTGGDANNHRAVFADYADSQTWTAVHLGQFVAMAILLAGLFTLCLVLDDEAGAARAASRLGAAAATGSLALYGALQAVDGVALKHAVDAWVSAPVAEQAARFASAEAIRWLEWGVRSYQDFTLGIALVLIAIAAAQTAWIPKLTVLLMALSGVAYLTQGWLGGAEGFSHAHAVAIVAAFALDVVWMIWLVVVAWSTQDSSATIRRPGTWRYTGSRAPRSRPR